MKTIIQHILFKTNLSEQEAWWMIEHITNKNRAILLHASALSLSQRELETIDLWIQKLSQEFIPLSYLLGSVPFLDLTIHVRQPILIPRQETEEWIACLIQELEPHTQNIPNILEIGTGSGCIALALAKAFPQSMVTAVDINPEALKLAQENADFNKISNVKFALSDLFNGLKTKDFLFDLIVSNPPYIDSIHKKTMMPQVIQWEDEHALFAKDEGLFLITEIIKQTPKYLKSQPSLPYQLILEHDNGQQEQIKKFANENNFTCESKKDLFGNWRTSWCKFIN